MDVDVSVDVAMAHVTMTRVGELRGAHEERGQRVQGCRAHQRGTDGQTMGASLDRATVIAAGTVTVMMMETVAVAVAVAATVHVPDPWRVVLFAVYIVQHVDVQRVLWPIQHP